MNRKLLDVIKGLTKFEQIPIRTALMISSEDEWQDFLNSGDDDSNQITITWHVDDVKHLDKTLRHDQCLRVLELADLNHDANIGINWEVLKILIDEVKRG